jgi:TRAP-type C4-dicarboxylate transport system permease small subunit
LTFFGILTGAGVALIAVLVTVDVIARNFGWFNLPWLVEVSEYALYAITFLATPWVLHHNAHISVDILVNTLPPKLTQILELMMNGLGLTISLGLVYYGGLATLDAYSLKSLIFKELIIPEWCLLWVMPFSGLLLTVEFVLRIRYVLRTFLTPGSHDPI